jgi:hypothetical protein
MPYFRHARQITRFLLVWFVLSLAAAIASPIVRPQATEVICSASGVMKLVPTGQGDSAQAGLHTLDCPMCAMLGAPPAKPATAQVLPPHPLSYAMRSAPAAHIAWSTAAPLPARGPPASN